jgi:hypothetical protein
VAHLTSQILRRMDFDVCEQSEGKKLPRLPNLAPLQTPKGLSVGQNSRRDHLRHN